DRKRISTGPSVRRGRMTRDQADTLIALAAKKDDFASTHDVRQYEFSTRNLLRFFRSLGASVDQASEVFRENSTRWAHGLIRPEFWKAFDHHDLWGRDGKPLILVGHPYGLDQNRPIYGAIASLGFEVRFDGESYYGFGTNQVLVCKPGSLRR